MHTDIANAARDLVAREGWLLDRQAWDEWLDLYLPDAQYWLPCWTDEGHVTDDPASQLSLIYYASRAGLEDRVYRILTERSLASTPMPRTSHLVSIVAAEEDADGDVRVESNWTTFSYRLERATNFFGTQTHVLRAVDDALKIASRKVIVMNDIIPSVLDIYSV